MKSWWKALDLDIRDGAFLIGLIALGVGMYGIDWRLAAGGVGIILIYLGLFHSRKGID